MSGRSRYLRAQIVSRLEPLSEARTECAIVDRATDLKQKIGTPPRPAYLLLLVHPPVHQEIGRAFGDRGANPQARAVPLGVVDQPGALAGQIAVQGLQGSP